MAYPLLRVPWHDTAWDGRVCANPRLNSSCLKLRRIAEGRNDAAEEKIKGELLSNLSEDEWPCCIGERVSFLAPFELNRTINHPYNRGPETAHGHFDDTPLRQPPYSAPAIPFRWVLRDNMRALGEEHALDVQEEREPDLGDFGETWVQDRDNQKALLDCFADHLKAEDFSLLLLRKASSFRRRHKRRSHSRWRGPCPARHAGAGVPLQDQSSHGQASLNDVELLI